jgi:curved DNA-binding protein CbpA
MNPEFDDNELFNKMKEKKSSSDANLNLSLDKFLPQKKSNAFSSDKPKKDTAKVEKFGFDYYKILGVDKDTPISDIQKRYRKLLAKYHPDKYKNLPEKDRKQKEMQFQLIQDAGKVLMNEDSKKLYDLEQKTIKSKDFQSQKNSFEEFIKMQEADISDETKQRARLDYESETQKLNKLRGFDPDKVKERLDKRELDKEIDDLRVRRDMDFIELSQKNMFEGRQFNPSEFNKLFEKDKKKQEKKTKKKQEKGEIVKVGEEFTAFNDNGLDNFISVDADYGDPFGDSNFKENTLFGKLDNAPSDGEISSDDEYEYKNEYDKHNYDRDMKSTDDRLSQLMRERESFDTNLKDTKTAGYKDVMEDQFGISRHFGKMIGKDFTSKSSTKKLDTDMVKVYNKMIGLDSDTSDDE